MKKVLFQLKGMQVMVVTTDDSDMDWQPVINDGAVHPVALWEEERGGEGELVLQKAVWEEDGWGEGGMVLPHIVVIVLTTVTRMT